MESPAPAPPAARLSGLLYAFLYAAEQRTFLGASLAGWLKWLPIIVIALALLFRWPLWVDVAALVAAVLVRVLYASARRNQFVRFVSHEQRPPDATERPLEDNERVAVRATGLFAVAEREEYVLQRPGQYWRVPVGDHAIMVERVPGRFLYQFIQAGTLKAVEPGTLLFGRQPARTLAITFLNTWGPQQGDKDLTFYSRNPNHRAPSLQRTMYLSFASEEERRSVWHNLTRDAAESVGGRS